MMNLVVLHENRSMMKGIVWNLGWEKKGKVLESKLLRLLFCSFGWEEIVQFEGKQLQQRIFRTGFISFHHYRLLLELVGWHSYN